VQRRKLLVSNVGCLVISERRSDNSGDRYQPLTALGNVGTVIFDTLNLRGQTFSGLRLLAVPPLFRDHLVWSPKLNSYLVEHYPEMFNGNFGSFAYVYAMNILDFFGATGVWQEFKTYPCTEGTSGSSTPTARAPGTPCACTGPPATPA
jgi:hypothetical protein